MTTYYTPERDFRDGGNSWYGRWSLYEDKACNGNGSEFGYNKRFYSDPVYKTCTNGARIVSITSVAHVKDSAAPPPDVDPPHPLWLLRARRSAAVGFGWLITAPREAHKSRSVAPFYADLPRHATASTSATGEH